MSWHKVAAHFIDFGHDKLRFQQDRISSRYELALQLLGWNFVPNTLLESRVAHS
jgi:hypothetical protein